MLLYLKRKVKYIGTGCLRSPKKLNSCCLWGVKLRVESSTKRSTAVMQNETKVYFLFFAIPSVNYKGKMLNYSI